MDDWDLDENHIVCDIICNIVNLFYPKFRLQRMKKLGLGLHLVLISQTKTGDTKHNI